MSALAVLQRLYAAVVWLYPWRFRAAFGAEMQAVFAEALAAAAAAGPRALLGLLAREARGLPASLLAQYARAARAEAARLRGQVVQPSWAQALAASVPGVLLVSGYWLSRFAPEQSAVWFPRLAWSLGAVGLAAGLWAARKGWGQPAWLWPTAGLLAWLGLAQVLRSVTNPDLLIRPGVFVAAAALALGWLAVRGPRLPRAAWLLLGLMVVLAVARALWQIRTQTYFGAEDLAAYRAYLLVAGLLPVGVMALLLVVGRVVARGHGLGAVLLLLGPCALLIDLLVDPTYGVRSSPAPGHAVLAPLLRTLLYGGLLVLAPVAVLRARTAAGQAAGLVAGLLVALVGVVVIPQFYWQSFRLDLPLLLELALGVLAAVAAFGWDGAAHPAPPSRLGLAD